MVIYIGPPSPQAFPFLRVTISYHSLCELLAQVFTLDPISVAGDSPRLGIAQQWQPGSGGTRTPDPPFSNPDPQPSEPPLAWVFNRWSLVLTERPLVAENLYCRKVLFHIRVASPFLRYKQLTRHLAETFDELVVTRADVLLQVFYSSYTTVTYQLIHTSKPHSSLCY